MIHHSDKDPCGSQSRTATRPPSLAAWTAKAAAIEDLPEPPFVEATAIAMGVCFMASASFIFLRESIFLDLPLVLHAFFEKVRRKRLSSSVCGLRKLTIWGVD
jgi:hypothetical protein